jgi:hypothetical protein
VFRRGLLFKRASKVESEYNISGLSLYPHYEMDIHIIYVFSIAAWMEMIRACCCVVVVVLFSSSTYYRERPCIAIVEYYHRLVVH